MSAAPTPDDEQVREAAAQREAVLRRLLSPEARMRLANVRMVRGELAGTVENYIIGMAGQGRLNPPVSDDQLKQILLSLQQPRRGFKINRV